jgi:hypothetical protein
MVSGLLLIVLGIGVIGNTLKGNLAGKLTNAASSSSKTSSSSSSSSSTTQTSVVPSGTGSSASGGSPVNEPGNVATPTKSTAVF